MEDDIELSEEAISKMGPEALASNKEYFLGLHRKYKEKSDIALKNVYKISAAEQAE